MSDGQQERSRARHGALLTAAVELLILHGMTAVTHRAVAERADVPPASVRYYFRSREQLLLACLDQIDTLRSEEAQTAVLEARALPRGSAQDMAALLLRAYYGPDRDDTALRGTIGWVLDCSRGPASLSEKLADLRGTVDQEMTALLDAGGFSDVPPELVMTVIDGSVVSAAAEGRPELARRAESATSQLLRGTFH